MKFLVLLLVLLVAVAWLAIGRRRDRIDDTPPAPKPPAPPLAEPATMLACAHCGVHLPGSEALRDAGGRAYCSDAHRLAGPRRSG